MEQKLDDSPRGVHEFLDFDEYTAGAKQTSSEMHVVSAFDLDGGALLQAVDDEPKHIIENDGIIEHVNFSDFDLSCGRRNSFDDVFALCDDFLVE